jgi:DNA-binding NarL/FixJ family response regulator
MEPIFLAIVEDDDDIREVLRDYFAIQPEIAVVSAFSSLEEFLPWLGAREKLDMLLLDIGLPGMSGLVGIELILEERPELDIVMLTAVDQYDSVYQALSSGAVAYLSKRAELPAIKDTLLIVHAGGSVMSPEIARKIVEYLQPQRGATPSQLTERQTDIVKGLVDGLSYKLIADKLDISVETVRDHIKKIYKKLCVNSKTEVIKKWHDGKV